MPDSQPVDIVEDAGETVESAVEEARESVADVAGGVEARLLALEARVENVIGALEERIATMAGSFESHNHDHQHPRGFRQLLDALDEMEHTDTSPVRSHPLYKPLFRRGE